MAIMDLFRPKWKHSNWNVAWDAVQAITDQPLLAKIAKSNCDIKVRWQSVERLTDQALLAEIAGSKIDPRVRERAIKKLTDKNQTLLANIAQTDAGRNVRLMAVRKLRNQAAISEVATTETDAGVREEAVRKLADQTLLANIAKTDSDGKVRLTAVDKLNDQAALAEIVHLKIDASVRMRAARKLTNQTLLSEIARNENEESSVREAAALKLMDEGVLLFEEGRDGSIRLLAWLFKLRGERVRWRHTAPYVNDQGEWTISPASIGFWRGKYVFRIPRDYQIRVLKSGTEYTETKTTTTNLELPSDTYCEFHGDDLKVAYRCFYKDQGECIRPVKEAVAGDYVVRWEFELLS